MLTFNLQASRTGNFYSGHEPGPNCWSDRENALVLSLGQARELAAAWSGGETRIEIAMTGAPPMSPYDFDHELFCVRGGNWFHYRHRERLNKMRRCNHRHPRGRNCKFCEARYLDGGGYWYDPVTGATINKELVT